MNQPPQQTVPQSQQQFKHKARKREAVQKYEPEEFKRNFFNVIPTDQNDLDGYQNAIEVNEGKLDLKRYAESFFELFIVGGLLGPGGVIIASDDQSSNPFSIFDAKDKTQIKARIDILNKLARRLKWIPKKLEETLSHLLVYINKFDVENREKLAQSCGSMASCGLISLSVLENTLKEHLVTDETSLGFLCICLKTYLEDQPIDHLTLSLRKASLDWRLVEFFPSSNRTSSSLVAHFNKQGLKGMADYYTKQERLAVKEKAGQVLKEMFTESKTIAEVSAYLKESVKTNKWPDHEMPILVWDSLFASVEFRSEKIDMMVVKLLSSWCPALALFCTSPKAQLGLLLHIQLHCYEDSSFIKSFRTMIQLLYNNDVVSESAIVYWYEKGSSQHGRKALQAQLQPFIEWLEEQEDSDEED